METTTYTFPAPESVKTIADLCNVLNMTDDYPLEFVEAVIENNGWTDLSANEFEVCSDGKEYITIAEDGTYVYYTEEDRA